MFQDYSVLEFDDNVHGGLEILVESMLVDSFRNVAAYSIPFSSLTTTILDSAYLFSITVVLGESVEIYLCRLARIIQPSDRSRMSRCRVRCNLKASHRLGCADT